MSPPPSHYAMQSFLLHRNVIWKERSFIFLLHWRCINHLLWIPWEKFLLHWYSSSDAVHLFSWIFPNDNASTIPVMSLLNERSTLWSDLKCRFLLALLGKTHVHMYMMPTKQVNLKKSSNQWIVHFLKDWQFCRSRDQFLMPAPFTFLSYTDALNKVFCFI